MAKLLIINMGSTSTKLALYNDMNEICAGEITIDNSTYRTPMVMDQLEQRTESVYDFLRTNEIDMSSIDMIVTRGPALWDLHSGAYLIDAHLNAVTKYAPRVQHAASIGTPVAFELSERYSIPAIFYDSASSDDAIERLHWTGIPEIRRSVTCHTLNSKAVGRIVAERTDSDYNKSTYIIAHLGGGITVSLHQNGIIVDTYSDDEGSMSPQRAGKIGTKYMIPLCFSGKYSQQEIVRKTRGKGGIAAYLGTDNMREVEAMIDSGDQKASELYELMAYQLSQSIGGLAAAARGKVDRIILTGGLAHSRRFTGLVGEYVNFIAPLEIVPGEFEMKALASGAINVLNGKETARKYTWLPDGIDDYKQLIERGEVL